jgi:tRNA (guanine-N7-)-methyltransferase
MYWNFSDITTGPGDGPFRAGANVRLEIGFGNGEYLEHLAVSKPLTPVVGIDVSAWCVTKAARRALSGGLENIRLLCGDARYLLKYAFAPDSISEAFMNFPCPWPKRRHAGRRVAGDDFAELLASRLAYGGFFRLATDVGWYAQAAKKAFASCPSFETGGVVRNPERDYLTKYERKWRALGRDIFQIQVAKTGNFQDERFPKTEEDETMDELDISPDSDAGNFKEKISSLAGESVSGKDFKIIFREIFFGGDDLALVKTISIDEGFEQHFYVKIIQNGGRLKVQLDSAGRPYRTPGVREALRQTARKLA